MNTQNQFSTVEEAIQAIKEGKLVIVADNEDRENEGDLVCAAEKITPELINFMAVEARGLICMPITRQLADKLDLRAMAAVNTDSEHTAFTVSIDGSREKGVSTGISALDRAKTIELCLEEDTTPHDLRRPGHIFPLIARDGGVLERKGQTEASVDLARLAGLKPAGVICEISNPDGSMARRDQLFDFAKEHNMPFITVEQIADYRLKNEFLLKKEAEASLPTKFGDFTIHAYSEVFSGKELIALTHGNIANQEDVTVRLHSECLTGDALSSIRCDCQDQLHQSMEKIAQKGSGMVIYLRQEGRGIGIINKIKAYSLQDTLGLDTYQANHELGFADDLRDFWSAAHVIKDMQIKSTILLTNNPHKISSLQKFGITVSSHESVVSINQQNRKYLEAKKTKHKHTIEL